MILIVSILSIIFDYPNSSRLPPYALSLSKGPSTASFDALRINGDDPFDKLRVNGEQGVRICYYLLIK
jgi:hypothetical protein